MSTLLLTSEKPVRIVAWIGSYYLLHAFLRIATGGSLQLDEAETLLLTQEWRWGYGSQGPLYTWLQKLVFLPFGPGLVGIALLKNFLLFLTPFFIHRAGREVLRDERLAKLAAVSLLFIPHFSWESQRDQSHLVLATACAAALWWIHLRLLQSRGTRWYVAFGLVVGAGVMAKYNFLVVPIGMVAASLFSTEGRRVWGNRRALLAPLMTIAITAPHLAWMFGNLEILTSQSHKLEAGDASALRGIGELFKGISEFLVMPVIYGAVLFWLKPVRTTTPARRELAAWTGWTLVATLVITALVVIGFGISNLKSRWFQPLFIILPVPVIFVWRHRLDEGRIRGFLIAALVAAMVILTGIHGRNFGGRWTGQSSNVNIAFEELSSAIRGRGFEGGIILCEDLRLAGNLRRQFPTTPVVVPTLENFVTDWKQPTLVVWDATKRETPREELVRFVTALRPDWNAKPPFQFVEAAGERGDPRVTRLGFVVLSVP